MRRDLAYVLAVLLASSGVATATNLVGHRIEWIRKPLAPPDLTTQTSQSNGVRENGIATQTTSVPASAEPTHRNGLEQSNGGQKPGLVGADVVLDWLNSGAARFIDAREPSEYVSGHLRGAINVPSNAIYANMDKVTSLIGPGDRVVVYCGGGGCEASHNVADALRRDFGFTNVLIYEKGWEEIESSGLFAHCIVEGDEP